MDNSEIVVSVCCITYNHAPYIRQCLDGFIMQKTDFAFEVLIHDDASTDGTTEIIMEYENKYPDIIKPIYEEENQWVKGRRGSAVFNYPRAKGKYIALCEGDDYWTDPMKLQKQVDFLENNLDFGLVYTKTNVFNEANGRMENYCFGMPASCFDDLVRCNCIPTLTVCYRKSLLERYYRDVIISSTWKMGDYPLWLYISMKTNIHFLDEITAVYRSLPSSASHHLDINRQLAFYKSSSEICAYFIKFAERYDLDKVYRQKYFDLVVSTYISYGFPVPIDSVRQYWIWQPKSLIKLLYCRLRFFKNRKKKIYEAKRSK